VDLGSYRLLSLHFIAMVNGGCTFGNAQFLYMYSVPQAAPFRSFFPSYSLVRYPSASLLPISHLVYVLVRL
jgi:hypothetical protein